MPIADLETIRSRIGGEVGVSSWLLVDQDRIDAFAEATEDRQFIHVDPEAAARTPFKGTIAHGFLTLSLLSRMAAEAMIIPNGARMAVNYGLDRVRFLAPLPSGSRVRGRFVLQSIEEKAAGQLLMFSSITIALASFATGSGGLISGALDARWAAVAGLAVIATALSSFASAKESLNQYQRNSERYNATAETLDQLCKKLDDVRAAAAQGVREPLETFVTTVHQQLSLEHSQWLESSEKIPVVLKDLEDALEKAKAKQPKPDGGGGGPKAGG